MNKRKRIATLKHRLKRQKMEKREKAQKPQPARGRPSSSGKRS